MLPHNHKMEIQKLNVNDKVIIESRVYQIVKSNYAKNKQGDERGLRVILKLLTQKELNDFIIKNE